MLYCMCNIHVSDGLSLTNLSKTDIFLWKIQCSKLTQKTDVPFPFKCDTINNIRVPLTMGEERSSKVAVFYRNVDMSLWA